MTKIIFLLTLYNYTITIKINTIKIVVYGLSIKENIKRIKYCNLCLFRHWPRHICYVLC